MNIKLKTIISLYLIGIWGVYAAASNNFPEVDLGGTIMGIAGQYNGLSLYNTSGQRETFDVNSASLITHANGAFQLVGSTSPNGTINALCKLPTNTNTGDFDLYIGGNFITLGTEEGVPFNNIARYSPANQVFTPLDEGLDGPVYSLYCDVASGSVYVGGAFTAPVNSSKYHIDSAAFGGSVAIWKNDTWSALPFKGFNGPVSTIAFNQDNNTFYFGGGFEATSNGDFGGTLGSQPINIQNAVITGGNSADTNGFNKPSELVCSGDTDGPGNTWLLRDGSPGYWRASFPVDETPSSVGIKNTAYEGRGTKSFRLLSTPDNTVLNLSYTDSNTKSTKYCSDPCPLTNDNSHFQVFTIVDPEPLTGIQIDILGWYGQGGGLHGIQFYQSEIVVRASGDSSFPNCSSIPFLPEVDTVGNWKSKVLAGIWESVLTITIPKSELATTNASVTLKPYIPQTGFYDVFLSIPSCLKDCGGVIPVNVTVNTSPGQSNSQLIDEVNNQNRDILKPIYSGTVAATTSSFSPNVVISIPKSAKPPSGDNAVVFINFVKFVPKNSSTPLGGLFQYNLPTSANSETTWSSFNSVLSPDAVISSIAVLEKTTIFIGGTFTNTSYSNIVKYDGKDFTPLAYGGLDGSVNTIGVLGGSLVVGGSFNATSSQSPINNLNNIARYDPSANQWSPVQGGVNGPVQIVTGTGDNGTSEVYVSGHFNTVLSNGDGNTAYNLAIWDNSNNSWSSAGYVDGQISTIVTNDYPGSNVTAFFGGKLSSAQTLQAFSGSLLSNSPPVLSALPINYKLGINPNPQIRIASGVFWNDTNQNNVVIFGGGFQIGNISNVAIVENGALSGLGYDFQLQGVINILYVQNDILYIGGRFNGSTSTTGSFSSLVLYDLKNRLFKTNPPQLTANGSTVGVSVNAIQGQGNTNKIIVAGNFDQAGSSACQSVCLWDTGLEQWSGLSGVSGLSGEVFTLNYVETSDESLYIGGNLQVNGTLSYLVLYKFKSSTFQDIGSGLPGPVISIAVDASSTTRLYIAGKTGNSTYLQKWDGKNFQVIGQDLGDGSQVSQINLVPVKDNHDTNNTIGSNRMLLIAGSLNLKTYGAVSVALYDGTTFYPYILSSKSGGTPGDILSIFSSSIFFFTSKKPLPVPLVILVSVSLALGLTFLIVAFGMIYIYWKRQQKNQPPPQPKLKPRDSILSVRSHTEFLSNLAKSSSATREKSLSELSATGVGGGLAVAGGGLAVADTGVQTGVHEVYLNGSGQTQTYYAKYDFEARDPNELGFQTGDKIYVIDRNDEVWWMGFIEDDAGNIRQGIFPSNYVTEDLPPDDEDQQFL